MAIDYRIPRPQSPFLDRRGEPTTEWYNWLKKLDSLFTTGDAGLQAQITQIAYILGSPDGTVANIPPLDQNFLPLDTIVRGEVSLTYSGTLEGGQVILTLVNDSATPGSYYYYGTDAAGIKGWYTLPDGAVPYLVPDGESYTVSLNKQALFTIPIDLGVGSSLIVDGILVEVD